MECPNFKLMDAKLQFLKASRDVFPMIWESKGQRLSKIRREKL